MDAIVIALSVVTLDYAAAVMIFCNSVVTIVYWYASNGCGTTAREDDTSLLSMALYVGKAFEGERRPSSSSQIECTAVGHGSWFSRIAKDIEVCSSC